MIHPNVPIDTTILKVKAKACQVHFTKSYRVWHNDNPRKNNSARSYNTKSQAVIEAGNQKGLFPL